MHFGAEDSIVLLGLLAAVAALLVIAQVVRVPYPILLVLGGLGLGFVPGMPTIELSPDLVLVAFLPPLLYGAASSPRCASCGEPRPIGLLAVGLVLATTVAVAVVAHADHGARLADGLRSRRDRLAHRPDAATAIARRLGLPRRLVDDHRGREPRQRRDRARRLPRRRRRRRHRELLARRCLGELRAQRRRRHRHRPRRRLGDPQVRRRLDNPPLEITISILSGYFAYLPADALDVSGVLAAVTVGVYMGWHTPELTTAQTRSGRRGLGDRVFSPERVLFVLIGLQLPAILDELSGASAGTLAGYGALVSRR